VPADNPSIGELWRYDGNLPLEDPWWRGRRSVYCIVVETGRGPSPADYVVISYFRREMRMSPMRLSVLEFLGAFVFVPLYPGLDHGAVTFIENMASLGSPWVARRQQHPPQPSREEVEEPAPRTQWDHLLDDDEPV
jgi:hypothetical protein